MRSLKEWADGVSRWMGPGRDTYPVRVRRRRLKGDGVSVEGLLTEAARPVLVASGLATFIWDATNGMRSLQDLLVNDLGLELTGWSLLEARGISADGRTIVGIGNNPAGNGEAWIVTIDGP